MQQAVILDGEEQKEIFLKKILEIIAKIPSLYHYDSYKSSRL